MLFSEIMVAVGEGSYTFDDKTNSVFVINKSPVKITFLPKKTVLLFETDDGKKENDIEYSDFSNITFKTAKKESDSEEEECILLFNGKEQFRKNAGAMTPYKNLFEKLTQNFTNNEECSPSYQIEHLIQKYSLNADSAYNKMIYRLLLLYNTRVEGMVNDGFLLPNSKIVIVLEAETGKITDNLGETAKKNISVETFFGGGNIFGNIASSAFNIAKAAGSRIISSLANEFTGNKDMIILTDKNVILSRSGSVDEYDFDDAADIFQCQVDETLAGVVDVYDDSGNKVLNNIRQTDWNLFKSFLRKIKKGADSIHVEENSSSDDGMEQVELKLEKLKKLVDKGLLTQEDFDKKKNELLEQI